MHTGTSSALAVAERLCSPITTHFQHGVKDFRLKIVYFLPTSMSPG